MPKTITDLMAYEINITGEFTYRAMQARYTALLDKAPPAPLLTEAQAGAKALRKMADWFRWSENVGVSAWSASLVVDRLVSGADRLEREGGNAPATAPQ